MKDIFDESAFIQMYEDYGQGPPNHNQIKQGKILIEQGGTYESVTFDLLDEHFIYQNPSSSL